MAFVRNWLLPILLATAQVAVWPGLAWWLGPEPDRGSVAVGLVATGLAAVALGRRRRSPRLSLAVTPLVAINDTVLSLVRNGFARGRLGEAMVNFVILALVLALGRSRYRWRAARQEAADQLARAEADSRSAATAERQRLARELHDVAAHHLTSIVVTAAAAERLPGQPELLTQALTFTANTGRETLAALHRLVAVMDVDTDRAPPLLVRVAELADGFVRLGQPVTVQADGDVELVPPAVAEAVYGIAVG